ncbi:MAG: ComEC/Rec2 family competence protein [Methylocella sp.]
MSETAIASGRLGKVGGITVGLAHFFELCSQAFEAEVALRRVFLWLPVATGAGVVAYMCADREPSLWMLVPLAAMLAGLAFLARGWRIGFMLLCGFCAFFAGELSAAWRSARVAAPVIDKAAIGVVEGFIEQMDFRRAGARFVLRVQSIEGLAPDATPFRVRLTTRRAPPFEAGAYVRLKARLLPPAHASLPGGYDFAKDAWFARIGGVGNALGRIEIAPAPVPAGPGLEAMMALDRGRMRWRAASTPSSAEMRGRSPPPWSRASATFCPTPPRM